MVSGQRGRVIEREVNGESVFLRKHVPRPRFNSGWDLGIVYKETFQCFTKREVARKPVCYQSVSTF